MICRDAVPADIGRLARISADAYRDDFARHVRGFDPAPFDIPHFERRFETALARLRVVGDGAPLGFSLVSEGNIDMFFLAPAARGSGAGLTLLRDAEQRGAFRLECFAENLPARRFYERHGWIVASHYQRPFGERPYDFVRYEKRALDLSRGEQR